MNTLYTDTQTAKIVADSTISLVLYINRSDYRCPLDFRVTVTVNIVSSYILFDHRVMFAATNNYIL